MENCNNDIIISIVIPVYNAEKYILRLIDSLKSQTFENLEFIFVDDLGQDESMRFVYEWAAVDSRVVILRNEQNLGEGGSRNRGIDAARGLYINTIDPDDWVAPNFYELLYAKAIETSADIIKGTRIRISEETQKEVKPRSDLNKRVGVSLKQGEPLYLRLNYEHQTIIFRQSLIKDEVKYGKSGNSADTTFLLRLCSLPATFAVEEKAYYYYLQRKTSATGEFSLKRSRNEIISFEEQIEYFLQKGSFDKYAYQYCADRYNAYIHRFVHAIEEGKITPQEIESYISDLKMQLVRIPDYTRLYDFDFKIFALIELDIAPRSGLHPDISACKYQVSDWVTYLMVLNGDKRKAEREYFKLYLASYFIRRKRDGASLSVMREELSQMVNELQGSKHKMLFYGIVKDVFIKNFPTYRKTLAKLIFESRK